MDRAVLQSEWIAVFRPSAPDYLNRGIRSKRIIPWSRWIYLKAWPLGGISSGLPFGVAYGCLAGILPDIVLSYLEGQGQRTVVNTDAVFVARSW